MSRVPVPESTTSTVTTEPSTPPTTTPDPERLVHDGVAALKDGYDFTATVTVGEEEAATTTGRWYQGSSILTVASGAASVEYLITPTGQWARTTSGEWSQVEGEAPVADPLAPLSDPTSTRLESWDGATATVSAIYPAENLGQTGDPIEASLTIVDGVLTELTYSFESDGVPVTVTTTFQPTADVTPITAP